MAGINLKKLKEVFHIRNIFYSLYQSQQQSYRCPLCSQICDYFSLKISKKVSVFTTNVHSWKKCTDPWSLIVKSHQRNASDTVPLKFVLTFQI